MKDALADCFEDLTDRFHSQLDQVTSPRPTINQTIKASAAGLLIKGASEFVRNRISGNYDRAEPDHNRAGSRNRVPAAVMATAEKWDR